MNKIFDIIKELKPSWRNEYEIVDALQMLLDEKKKIQYYMITDFWKDTGTPEDILHANELVLDSIGTENQFLIDPESEINNKVVLGKNSNI